MLKSKVVKSGASGSKRGNEASLMMIFYASHDKHF